ncbi:MAG: hypothetical protein V2I26_08125 [Halieaceae bacterium]|jgi:hypothetical protein|nr:hypothetical protein [Halieaceae bacterium]
MTSKCLLILVLTLGCVVSAQASFITIETEFTVTDMGDGPVISIGTRNRGDESAFHAQIEMIALGHQFTGSRTEKLDIDRKMDTDFRVGGIFDLPGRYPIIIKTHYQDANGYPFSALTSGFYDAGAPALSRVLVAAEPIEFPSNGKGRLEFILRNNGSTPHDVSLKLFLPDELVTIEDGATLTMAPNSSVTVPFALENFSALANSRYSVVMLANYEADGKYFGSVGSTVVHITDPTLLAEYGWSIPWVVALVALLAVILVLLHRRRRRPAG